LLHSVFLTHIGKRERIVFRFYNIKFRISHTKRRSRQFHRCCFFKHLEFYEISYDVSLKPIMQINEIKKVFI